MNSVELDVMYRFANARIRHFPFQHIYVEGIFPDDFYKRLQESIPDPEDMMPILDARGTRGYPDRYVLGLGDDDQTSRLPESKRKFWVEFWSWLGSGRLGNMALQKFQPLVDDRFRSCSGVQFHNEGLLTLDKTNYSISPHPDSIRKVITCLFYLPQDRSQIDLGTSIYLPKDPSFQHSDKADLPFDAFHRVHTMPFAPNSLFAFCRTQSSYHGVEVVKAPNTNRWLLLFDVYASNF